MRTTLLALGAVLLVAILAVAIWLYTPDKPRAELEARWAGPPSSFLDVAGVRLHLRDTGPRDGPAVLMLHGFGASLHTWEDWARGLEDRFRVIRFDFPGFALTGPDPSGVYTDARSVEVIAALMDRLGLPRASLVGSSMGGRIAWTFAATHPDRVERLVLLAPDGFASPGRAYGQEIRVPALMRTLPWTLPMPLLRRTAAAAFGDPSLMTDELAERYRDMLLVPGVRQAILDRTPQNTLEDPAPDARPHHGTHAAGLGRARPHGAGRERRRLPAPDARHPPGHLPRRRARPAGGGAGAHAEAGAGLPAGGACHAGGTGKGRQRPGEVRRARSPV
jgi:pimeloyl-ACP methyl ester carboxylesterase